MFRCMRKRPCCGDVSRHLGALRVSVQCVGMRRAHAGIALSGRFTTARWRAQHIRAMVKCPPASAARRSVAVRARNRSVVRRRCARAPARLIRRLFSSVMGWTPAAASGRRTQAKPAADSAVRGCARSQFNLVCAALYDVSCAMKIASRFPHRPRRRIDRIGARINRAPLPV